MRTWLRSAITKLARRAQCREDVPEKNKKLMISVCTIIQSLLADESKRRDYYLAEYYKLVGAEEEREKK
jgi:hypothetical protein